MALLGRILMKKDSDAPKEWQPHPDWKKNLWLANRYLKYFPKELLWIHNRELETSYSFSIEYDRNLHHQAPSLFWVVKKLKHGKYQEAFPVFFHMSYGEFVDKIRYNFPERDYFEELLKGNTRKFKDF